MRSKVNYRILIPLKLLLMFKHRSSFNRIERRLPFVNTQDELSELFMCSVYVQEDKVEKEVDKEK